MLTGILHLHITVALIFIILFGIKSYLLWAGKVENLASFRAKTKMAEMIVGILFLGTGVFLLTQTSVQAYHIVKLLIVFASIPLGIIAFKKQNKILPIIVLLLMCYAFRVATVKTLNPFGIGLKSEEKTTMIILPDSTVQTTGDILNQNKEALVGKGKEIFSYSCTPCHGEDGKLGASGAKDLTISEKTHEEKVTIIRYGKGLMTPFGSQLSEEEIEAVASYVDSMRR